MSEVTNLTPPSIVYTPEGELKLHREFTEDVNEFSSRLFDALACRPGVTIAQEGQGHFVNVDLEKTTSGHLDNKQEDDEWINGFIDELEHYCFYDYEATGDPVFSLEFWDRLGANGVVYPRFQRWLNAEGLSQTLARRVVDSMALAWGKEDRKNANRGFEFHGKANSPAQGSTSFMGFSVKVRPADFSFHSFEEEDDAYVSRSGEVIWNDIDLSTIGNCACWGVSGDERSHMRISRENQRLYEISPHNVDFARQSLSLALGMATLAYEASQYTGQEDIFEHAEIHERRDPKTSPSE